MDKVGKFRILIRLALVDDCLDESEKNFLLRLATLDDMTEIDIEALIREAVMNADDFPIDSELSYDEKIEILSELIKIMKVDGKVLDAEVKFCERIARSFGFDERAIGFLSGSVHIDPRDTVDLSKIQFRMRKYLVQN